MILAKYQLTNGITKQKILVLLSGVCQKFWPQIKTWLARAKKHILRFSGLNGFAKTKNKFKLWLYCSKIFWRFFFFTTHKFLSNEPMYVVKPYSLSFGQSLGSLEARGQNPPPPPLWTSRTWALEKSGLGYSNFLSVFSNFTRSTKTSALFLMV